MNRPHLQNPAPANPIVRLLMFVGATVMLALSLFLGAMIFLVLLGLGLVLGLVLMARVWWIRRKLIAAHEAMRQRQGDGADPFTAYTSAYTAKQRGDRPGSSDKRGDVIEGEYRREE